MGSASLSTRAKQDERKSRVRFATASKPSTQVQDARYSLRHRAVAENRNTKG